MAPQRYLTVLRAPHARRLVAAALVGRLPVGIASLALVLLVREATGSFASAGGVAAAYALAAGIASPAQGRLVDRVGQPLVLVPCAGLNAAALVALVLAANGGANEAVLVGCAALAGAALPPLSACMRALWPVLVGGDEALVGAAFALEAVLVEAFFITGPLLAGLLVAIASPQAAVLVAAGLGVTGTLGFASAPLSRSWRGAPRAPGRAGPLGARGMRTLVISVVPAGMAFGTLEVAMPAFADAHGAAASAGVPLAAMAAGSMAGGLWYGARTWPGPVGRRYVTLSAVFAAGLAPLALASSIPVMAVLAAAAGLALAPVTTCVYLLIDEVAPPGTVTESYTWVITANVAGAALGAALAGAVVEGPGWRWALLGACAGAALASLLARLRRGSLLAAPGRHRDPAAEAA